MNREEFEASLDGHRLWIKEEWVRGPRWYLLKRNGRTKTWKRDKNAWEIPVKWKLNVCLRIGDYNIAMLEDRLRANSGQPEHKVEGSKAEFDRYIAGDR